MYQRPADDEHAYWLIFCQDKLVQLADHPGLIQGRWHDLSFVAAYQDRVLLLGQLRARNCYLVDLGHERPAEDNVQLISLREAMLREGDEAFAIMARAWQLALFYRTHRYCGQCGSAMHQVDWEVATHCHRCHHRCYPRISPCIIVAICDGNKILLARGSRHKEGMYSTLAGFVESGESLEEAVHREVMEEVGVRVRNLRYFDSQPWPFPHSLMVGFLADYDAGEIQVDGEEILDAQWFDFDALPLIPPPFSIAGRLIQAARENCK